MDNKYINLVCGKEVEMNDDEFAKSYTSSKIFENDFFDNHNFKVVLTNEDTQQYDLIFNNSKIHIIFLNIKNSGMNNNKYKKRFQISSKLNYIKDDNPYYVIGAYNTGDKILYLIAELENFIQRATKGKTYSSFWLDYYSISQVYEKDIYTWKNRNGKMIRGISNIKLAEILDDVQFFKMVFFDEYSVTPEVTQQNEENDDNNTVITHELFDENDSTKISENRRLKRNSSYRNIALERENYTCELCGTTTTFKDKDGKEYFDGHHLIMYNFDSQQKYEKCLDHPDNIICLCPTCHKKIHYGEPDVINESVVKLLIKHNKLFEIYDVDSVEEILDNYLKGVDDDE